ncbi:MAG: hypothetical protein Q7S22_06605 [Candidatus Micrarchaeota archaeon]|nr:hypothetical protein [Candidatus Micrarchaeota archaeon]
MKRTSESKLSTEVKSRSAATTLLSHCDNIQSTRIRVDAHCFPLKTIVPIVPLNNWEWLELRLEDVRKTSKALSAKVCLDSLMNMKNFFVVAFLVLLFASSLFAQNRDADNPIADEVKEIQTGGSSPSIFEAIKDWRALSLLVIMLMVIIISLAIMFGKSFDLPDLIAWGHTELSQVIATGIIILILIPTLFFLDSTLSSIVDNSNLGFKCSDRPADNCAIMTANAYLRDTVQDADGSVRGILTNADKAAKSGSQRLGGYATYAFQPPLLQFQYSISPNAGRMIYLDQYSVILEYFGTIFTVLISQQFFVSEIAFKVGPSVFLFGILLRSFFLTRKLGGLLMAVGIGVMYVLPLMYVFDWYTLNITLYGDSILVPQTAMCPVECNTRAPGAYSSDGKTYADTGDAITKLGLGSATNDQVIASIQATFDGTRAAVSVPLPTGGTKTLISCEYASKTPYGKCPTACRERPYPLTEECTSSSSYTSFISPDPATFIEKACNHIPAECIVTKLAAPPAPEDQGCPSECKVIPPLKINCDITNTVFGTSNTCLESKHVCRATRTGIPAFGSDDRPANCEELLFDTAISHDAWACPAPVNENAADAAFKSCVYVLPSKSILDSCSACLKVDPSYTYKPAVRLNCGELCGSGKNGPVKIPPSVFARKTKEGMIGPSEIKDAASLMLPSYILPLLNITVTLMFIRSLSNMLGGDIEIPGVSKII